MFPAIRLRPNRYRKISTCVGQLVGSRCCCRSILQFGGQRVQGPTCSFIPDFSGACPHICVARDVATVRSPATRAVKLNDAQLDAEWQPLRPDGANVSQYFHTRPTAVLSGTTIEDVDSVAHSQLPNLILRAYPPLRDGLVRFCQDSPRCAGAEQTAIGQTRHHRPAQSAPMAR